MAQDPAIIVKDLTFSYGGGAPVLLNVSTEIPPGSRVVLTGDNGAGKTTLLRILGGKHMVGETAVRILGCRADFDPRLNDRRAYVSSKWGMRTVAFSAHSVPLEADIPVHSMMKDRQAAHKDRWDRLVKLLDIDINWRMNQVSDGQRRRVQLLLSLLPPYDVLLLDEVTVDLDVVTRQDFLQFLADECAERGVSVVYATHIFDGLDDWATHIAYISNGRMAVMQPLKELDEYLELRTSGTASPLYRLVSRWIRQSRDERDERAAHAQPKQSVEQHRFDRDLHKAAGGFAPGRMAAYA